MLPKPPGRFERLLDFYREFRQLSRIRSIIEFARRAFSELDSAPGRANFIGFMIVLLILVPLVIYGVAVQLIPEIGFQVQAIELTLVPDDPTVMELALLLASTLAYPFLFALCLRMFEVIEVDD